MAKMSLSKVGDVTALPVGNIKISSNRGSMFLEKNAFDSGIRYVRGAAQVIIRNKDTTKFGTQADVLAHAFEQYGKNVLDTVLDRRHSKNWDTFDKEILDHLNEDDFSIEAY